MCCLFKFQRIMLGVKDLLFKLQKQFHFSRHHKQTSYIAPVKGKGEVIPMFPAWPPANIKGSKKGIGIPNEPRGFR
jgi:hypothetical protein